MSTTNAVDYDCSAFLFVSASPQGNLNIHRIMFIPTLLSSMLMYTSNTPFGRVTTGEFI
ncbi:UNVERIFIED_CONTAM: hypothetical protein FKN15_024821 [Acipenser sinensis]